MDRTVSTSATFTTARPRWNPVFQAGCFWLPRIVGAVVAAGGPSCGTSRGVPRGQTCRSTVGSIARREAMTSLSGLTPGLRRNDCRPARNVRPWETDSRLARGGRGSAGASTSGRQAKIRGPWVMASTGHKTPLSRLSIRSSKAGGCWWWRQSSLRVT